MPRVLLVIALVGLGAVAQETPKPEPSPQPSPVQVAAPAPKPLPAASVPAAKATEITDSFPGMLRGALTGAFNGKAKVSRSEGDLALVGRFVDANAGSKAAKWLIGLGAGSETATWDLKILEVKSGEILLAVHHRAISGTAMSNIQDKLVKWADKFATFTAARAFK